MSLLNLPKSKKSTDWKWSFKDYPKQKNGLKVFSCFACGGGSTMGYKLAGCEVIGCCEIDKKMNEIYVKNHNPKYNYLMDIRDFNKLDDLPEELYNLDILDGSPPCTTFSMAGDREDSWGKAKKFREGQTEQTLDDLPFIFCETVNKLKPKVVIMENVKGMILGNALNYYNKVLSLLKKYGYNSKGYLLNAATMGVPQRRERIFIIGVRNDIDFDFSKLNMNFNYAPITYGMIKEGKVKRVSENSQTYKLIKASLPNDKYLSDVNERLYNKLSGFQSYLIDDDTLIPTTRTKPDIIDRKEMAYISWQSIRNAQTFPEDYIFGSGSYSEVGYVCGMSVPPIMIKRIVTRIIETGLFNKGEILNEN